jgi:hypothetical protein
MIQPPSVGPIVGPTKRPIEKSEAAKPRWPTVNVSKRIACEVDSSAPPPIPWRNLKATSSQMLWAFPQATDAAVNRRIEPM